jgi:hypothetical protein
MDVLSSIELPHWLMIGGVILVTTGFPWVLHSPATTRLRLILTQNRLHHAQRRRRCQGGSILQATRETNDRDRWLACGKRGADVRPDFSWNAKPVGERG